MSSLPQLKVVVVGHVDHGKSTLIGRLFHDTGSLPDGKLESIQRDCAARGMEFEWSFLMDALKAERDQNVTIESAHAWFRTNTREYVLIDAPGHREFLRNMISGAAQADAAIIVVDAVEGVKEQSRRHGYLLKLLNIKSLLVVVNKMDAVQENNQDSSVGTNYRLPPPLAGGARGGHLSSFHSTNTFPPLNPPPQAGGETSNVHPGQQTCEITENNGATFDKIRQEFSAFLKEIGLEALVYIPISARDGDNIVNPSQRMPWYKGSTLLEALQHCTAPGSAENLPLRITVQDVYKFDSRRIIAGMVESGKISAGDEIILSPSNARARVKEIVQYPQGDNEAASTYRQAGETVGLILEEQIFVERGDVISHSSNQPLLANRFNASIFWLGRMPLIQGKIYTFRIGTNEIRGEVESIKQVINTDTLEAAKRDDVRSGEIAEITVRLKGLASLDDFANQPLMGRFVITDGGDISGGGIINLQGITDQRVQMLVTKTTNIFPTESALSREQREAANGHLGGILWFTGLPGSGKSTLAQNLERMLFLKGYQTYVLDGDNIRKGLSGDLDFSPESRAENIRRVAEVANLLADAGMIAITAFISPYRDDRRRARSIGHRHFSTVYVKCAAEECEKRDPKGLYKKARAGEITDFTGVNAPYEEPENPDLIIDTAHHSLDECLSQLLSFVERNFKLSQVF